MRLGKSSNRWTRKSQVHCMLTQVGLDDRFQDHQSAECAARSQEDSGETGHSTSGLRVVINRAQRILGNFILSCNRAEIKIVTIKKLGFLHFRDLGLSRSSNKICVGQIGMMFTGKW